jgi:predicted XRE-type DNA-binding protein
VVISDVSGNIRQLLADVGEVVKWAREMRRGFSASHDDTPCDGQETPPPVQASAADVRIARLPHAADLGILLTGPKGLNAAFELALIALAYLVFKILEGRKLNPTRIAAVLGIAERDASHHVNWHFSRFTTDKLLDFLKRLDQKVTFRISSHRRGEPYQEVTFGP